MTFVVKSEIVNHESVNGISFCSDDILADVLLFVQDLAVQSILVTANNNDLIASCIQ